MNSEFANMDLEKYDFNKIAQEVVCAIKKTNIMVCGATGVVKSSLVNDIFSVYLAEVGEEGKAQTRGIHKYGDSDCFFNLYDTEGYEIGQVNDTANDRYYRDILSFIDKMNDSNPGSVTNRIHEVWYCVSAGNKRFYDVDRKLINSIRQKNIPLMILLTKVDSVSGEELDQMFSEIRNQINGVDIYTYSIAIPENMGEYNEYVQKKEIIEWAAEHLDEYMRLSLFSVIDGFLEEKKKYIFKSVIPEFLAAHAQLHAQLTNLVSPLFNLLQVEMAMCILNVFNIGNNNVRNSILGVKSLAKISESLFKQWVWDLIPFGRNIASLLNLSIEKKEIECITAITGVAITILTESYLKERMKNEGNKELTIDKYITSEKIEMTIDWIKSNTNKKQIDIEGIIEKAEIIRQRNKKMIL